MSEYVVLIIPVAHRNAMRLLFNLWYGQAPEEKGFTRDYNATGNYADPVTHSMLGMPMSAEQSSNIKNIVNNMPTPEGGWPWVVNGETVLDEADALAAAAALEGQVGFGGQTSSQVVTAVLAANNLKVVEPPEQL